MRHKKDPNKQKGESFAKRTTFYTNIEWQAGCKPDQYTYIQGQMYVESLEPQRKTQQWPIILIHGDYHSSQIWLTKPDGEPGWASYFLGKGFHVYLVDLPGTGKSNTLSEEAITLAEVQSVKASQIERGVTAPEVFNHITDLRWATAQKHNKWPGTGRRGDPFFNRYCASLTALFFTLEERQTLAQNALRSLLKTTKKALLIGEGTGATAAWLAADVAPEMVAGVVAVEPPGPPFCEGTVERNGKRKFDSFTSFSPDRLKYGLSNIPLTFDPVVRPEIDPERKPTGLLPLALAKPQMNPKLEPTGLHPLDLALFVHIETGRRMVLQYSPDNIPAGFSFKEKLTNGEGTNHVRKLTNLSKMRHVIITGEASSHSEYDVSTIHFMKQAGLTVDCGFLERYRTHGNGHLMFLETNSDEVAAHIMRWMQKRAGQVNEPVAVKEPELAIVPPPTPAPSPQAISVNSQSRRSPKRARRAVDYALELSWASVGSHNLIDLTEEPQTLTSYRSDGPLFTTSEAESMLSFVPGVTFPSPCKMPPPPLPSQSNWPRTSAGGQETPMSGDVKRDSSESLPTSTEFFTPPAYAAQGRSCHVSSSPRPARANPQQLALGQNESSGSCSQGPTRPRPNHATLCTIPEHPTHDPTAASPPTSTAVQANPWQLGSERREASGAENEESERSPSSHDNPFTAYRFHVDVPQSMSKFGSQTTETSARHVYNYTRIPEQQAAPLPQQTIPFPGADALDDFDWQDNLYTWPTHGGHISSSSAQAPRLMPNIQVSDDVASVSDQFWESSGNSQDWALDGMPSIEDIEAFEALGLPLQKDDDPGMDGYAF